jgi:hypothetical protein
VFKSLTEFARTTLIGGLLIVLPVCLLRRFAW